MVIQVTDDQAYPLFDSCTDRLGREPFVLEAGQRVTTTFEIEATLAEGSFHVNGYLFRYTTNAPYDKWANAATFFVSGPPAVRGSVNMQPRLISCDIHDDDGGRAALADVPVVGAGAGVGAAPGVGDADEDGITP